MNTYTGSFDNGYQVFKNGLLFDYKPSLKIRNHSPTGFAWSYGGSGPAQLALAILLEETNLETAERRYMDFKWKVISGLPQKSFVITSEDVKKFLENLNEITD